MHICFSRPEGGCMLRALYSELTEGSCTCAFENLLYLQLWAQQCGHLCIMNIQNKCQMTQCICSSFSCIFASSLPHVPKKREIVESHCLPECKLLKASHGHLAVLSFVFFGYKRQIPLQTDSMGSPCLWGEGNDGFSSIGLQSFSVNFYSQ